MNSKWFFWAIPIFVSLFSFSQAEGAILVPQDFPTIQGAINSATEGDEIVVSPGRYIETLVFQGPNITLSSTDPLSPQIVTSTIIDASKQGSVITFRGTETANCILTGFTITGGFAKATSIGGGAIYGSFGLPTIQYNHITKNQAVNSGGGLIFCNGKISNNLIFDNSAQNGGASYTCHGLFTNNVIFNNHAKSRVGGLFNCDGDLISNTLFNNTDNTTNLNEGRTILFCNGEIKNCIIWNNTSELRVDVSDSSLPVYSNISNWTEGGEGNISADPLFLDPGNKYFQLRPNSPCIDAGGISEVALDINGTTRGIDGTSEFRGDGSEFDIGAYEFGGIRLGTSKPEKPLNIFPTDASRTVTLSPTLVASPFSDSDENSFQYASYWKIESTSGNFSYSETKTTENLTSLTTPLGVLDVSTEYQWKVIYIDETQNLSDWSIPTTFTTTSKTLFVPDDFDKIQDAIDFSLDGFEIIVKPGVYYENLNLNGKNITLRSTDPTDPNIVDQTIIDGQQLDSVIKIGSGEAVISGLTIQNGQNYKGGGVYGSNNNLCSATIQYNNIKNNQALGGSNNWVGGGGIFGCNGPILNNLIWENTSVYNGSAISACQGVIANNIFFQNSDDNKNLLYSCGGIIKNNIFYNNTTGNIFYLCDGSLINNTIYRNQLKNYAIHTYESPIFENCIFWGNRTESGNVVFPFGDQRPIDYCCIENWTGEGKGNITLNPRLVDPENGNFNLGPDSPCIDAGSFISDVTEDFEGNQRGLDKFPNQRGDGSNYDSGAFEFTGTASLTSPPETPTNITPENGSTNIPLAPILVSSVFIASETESFHVASQWQIDTSNNFDEPLFDSQVTKDNLTSIITPYIGLDPQSKYLWRVRYFDSFSVYSNWSYPTSFTTRSPITVSIPEDYSTIQDAIDNSYGGDTIIVSPGTYYGNLHFLGRDIILKSTNPKKPEVVAQTILDGQYFGSVVSFSGVESPACVLEGFTITHGVSDFGGGINGKGTLATIKNNVITENEVFSGGGGIHNCDGEIFNNTISLNKSNNSSGGGISNCDGNVRENVISKNSADRDGGGVFKGIGIFSNNIVENNTSKSGGGAFFLSGGLIENNLIRNNRAESRGGGTYQCNALFRNNLWIQNRSSSTGGAMYETFGSIINNTFWNNSAQIGGAINDFEGTILNSIFWLNFDVEGKQIKNSSNPSYSCIQNWEGGGIGNITEDPLFIDPPFDFHLSKYSPCINSGTKSELIPFDMEGDTRPLGVGFDMGADEFQNFNYITLFEMANVWNETAFNETSFHSPWDLNFDDIIEKEDILELNNRWHGNTPETSFLVPGNF